MTEPVQRKATPEEEALSMGTRLLDAAETCFIRYGVAKTTMEDIARAAGVARITVYRHYKNRDDLYSRVLVRDASRVLAGLKAHVASFHGLNDWLVEALAFVFHESRSSRVYPMLFSPDAVEQTWRLSISPEIILEHVLPILEPVVAQAWASAAVAPDITAEELAEWFVRISLSFLTLPSVPERGPEELKSYLRRILPNALHND